MLLEIGYSAPLAHPANINGSEGIQMESKDLARLRLEAFYRDHGVGQGSTLLTLLGPIGKELHNYDRLNIRREDIWVVERGYKGRMLIPRKNFGVRFFPGELREFLHFARQYRPPMTFDGVFADFCGGFWAQHETLNQLLPFVVASHSRCLAVTSLDKRDHDFLEVGRSAEQQIVALVGSSRAQQLFNGLGGQYDALPISTKHDRVLILRELGFLWWLALALERLSIECQRRMFVDDLRRFVYRSPNNSTMHLWLIHFCAVTELVTIPQSVEKIAERYEQQPLQFLGA